MCYCGYGFQTDQENANKRYLFSPQGPNPNGIVWYGYGGFTGNEGDLVRNRYKSGFLIEKSGADASVTTYRYMQALGNPFNDFDAAEKDTCIVYPAEVLTDDVVMTSTLQWEGIREGLYDFLYVYTLKKYIQDAQQLGFADGDTAEIILDNIIRSIPWSNDFDSGSSYIQPGNCTNDMLQQKRLIIATQIEIMYNALQSLVGYWKFDNSAIDSSFYENNGTLEGNPQWVDGQTGEALEFNGTDDYVDCGNDPSLNITGAITVEAWIKQEDNSGTQDIFSKGQWNNSGYRVCLLGNRVYYYTHQTDSYQRTISFAEITLNEWHYIAVTREGAQARIYIDGIDKTEFPGTHIDPDSCSLSAKIGRYAYSPLYYFNGIIDDVRVHAGALSADAVYSRYCRGIRCGYWKFDNSAIDSSSYENDGTLEGNPQWVNGQIGKALEFNGTDDYVDCGNDPSLNITGAITVEAWIKQEDNSGTQDIFSKGQWNNSGYRVCLLGNRVYYYTHQTDSYQRTISFAEITLNEWHYIAVTREGAQARIYIDGIDKTEFPGTHIDPDSCSLSAKIGRYAYSPLYYFNGIIDDVRVHADALSADAIYSRYCQGIGDN
ncbi:MAG: LamG domain-containing protein [Victivallaceae bacterium]|nr:LamG domain-containing protein [Victivallaceae bacterium]